MEISPIRAEADHRAAVAEIERLWDAREGTEAFDRLHVLATLVDAWEARLVSEYPLASKWRC